MVQGGPGRRELPPSHHVARYCRPRAVREDGTLAPSAFRLRHGEEYLSTNWLEYFHDSDRASQIAGVRQALADKGFRVSRNATFAVLNIGTTAERCRDELDAAIQFVALGEPHDPSHTGIFGYTIQKNDAIAALLAQLLNPGEVYPATVSPAQEA